MNGANVPVHSRQARSPAVLDALEVSQAGAGRHKGAVCAYRAGFEAGVAEGIRRAQEAVAGLERHAGR